MGVTPHHRAAPPPPDSTDGARIPKVGACVANDINRLFFLLHSS